MDQATQKRVVSIDRGLFLVRYAGAEDQTRPPLIRIKSNSGAKKSIDLLLHPDHKEAVLWQPGSCLAVRASSPAELAVEVVASVTGGSAAATVRIEPLTQGSVVARRAPFKSRSRATYDLSSLQIISHVTGIGDLRVNANEWIAGPAAPSRIEGIAIEWPDKPHDIEMHYAVKTAKPEAASGRPVRPGAFAGTRGKAMPIVSLLLELSGPAAEALQFVVDALFLGAPTLHMTGRRVIAAGPTGREPLVGLRLALKNMHKGELAQVLPPTPIADSAAADLPKRSATRFKARVSPADSEISSPTPRAAPNPATPAQPAVT